MNNEINYVSPFKQLVITIGNLPTAYLESMSYYEAITYLVNYLSNNVIPALNNNGLVVEEVQAKFVELKNYVDNYFENLDVQEEINNKLDNMAEDGTLTALIGNYVQPLIDEQNETINNFKNSVNGEIQVIDNKVTNAVSGSPLVASSTSEMTDTSRVYVNTTDGKWYYYDGDSWEIGGTYQSSGIGENSITYNQLNSELKDVFSKNVEYTSTTGHFISYSNGTIGNNVTYSYTSPIELDIGESIDIIATCLNGVAVLAEYDSVNEKYTPLIQGTNLTKDKYTYIAPSKKQVVISFKTSDELEIMKYVSSNNLLTLCKSINNLYTPIYTNTIEHIITYPNGLIGNNTNYMYTSAFNIKKGQTLTIECTAISGVAVISEYENETIKPYINGIGDENHIYQYFAKKDTQLILSCNYKKIHNIKIEYNIENIINLSNNQNILYNKKYVALGDSFTHGDFTGASVDDYHITDGLYTGELKVYPYIIGNRNNMIVQNLAVNGMTLAERSGSTNSIMQQEAYKSLDEDTDYITIKIGINDENNSIDLGTINSNDETTFYGAYNTLLTYLLTNYPNAKIGIIVTNGLGVHTNETNNNKYANATIEIAEKYSIPIINEWIDYNTPLLCRTGKINVPNDIRTAKNNNWKVSNDNIHPNAKCHEFESTIIENFLRSL